VPIVIAVPLEQAQIQISTIIRQQHVETTIWFLPSLWRYTITTSLLTVVIYDLTFNDNPSQHP
jgi:hypothetical protein